jgi:tRNA pseudouridine55 synthase
MRDGVIVINKPWKITSFGVVRQVKHITGVKKAGHLGTLDPMARGVLPVALGKATRLMDLLDLDLKIYECSARLGISSDTLDIWGKVEDSGPSFDISEEALIDTIKSLSGKVSQTPLCIQPVEKTGKGSMNTQERESM